MKKLIGLFKLCWESLLDVIFPGPSSCSACGRLLKEYNIVMLCPMCQEELKKFLGVYMDGKTFLAGIRDVNAADGFDYVGASYRYEGAARNLVRALKYKGRTHAARTMAYFMADELKKRGIKADIIVPVPAHADREKQRGYNQAELIARELSGIAGIPVEKKLVKCSNTPSQVALDEKERWRNVLGAFALEGRVEGLSILLVDDVITTGATMYFSSNKLKSGGARSVISMAFAIALQKM